MEDPNNHMLKFEGVPRKRGRRGEDSRWKRFIRLITPWAERANDLSDRYANAKASEAEADAKIKESQAGEIAARADNIRAKNLKATCDIINTEIGLDDSDLANELKIAALLDANPGLAAQFEKIQEIKSRHKAQYGTDYEVHPGDPASPPLLEGDGESEADKDS